MEQLPLKLTIERQRRGWSRAELARRADLNPATVSVIESARFQPYPGQLRKLARALGVPEDRAHLLLNRDGSPDR
jgi:transcriptional regulator with XRE-family HTH domain